MCACNIIYFLIINTIRSSQCSSHTKSLAQTHTIIKRVYTVSRQRGIKSSNHTDCKLFTQDAISTMNQCIYGPGYNVDDFVHD